MGGGYFGNRCGVAKVLTVILGGVTVAFTAYAYDRVWKEEVFLGVVVAVFIISVLYLIAYAFVRDLELQTTNKAFDSGFHFLAALLLLASGSLAIYSAIHLRRDTEYLCAFGIDRGIPCLYDRDDPFKPGGQGFYDGGGFNRIPVPVPPAQEYGYPGTGSGYGRLRNGYPEARTFLPPDWLAWLKSSKAQFAEKCQDLLPRILNCNRYFELKFTAGILGLLNGILYAITGIMVISAN